jgi:isocitrate dehydrogenase (NAD+)
VTLIPGDGIGNELADCVKSVFEAANVPVDWDEYDVSGYKNDPENNQKMKAAIDSLKRNKVGLKGILFTPLTKFGTTSLNVSMRKDLDIYASVGLVKNFPGIQARHKNVDIAIIRENTEGEYSGLEHESYPGVVESLKVITKAKSERIARLLLLNYSRPALIPFLDLLSISLLRMVERRLLVFIRQIS